MIPIIQELIFFNIQANPFFQLWDFFGRFFFILHVFTRLPDFFQILRIFFHMLEHETCQKREFFLQVVEKRNKQGQSSR